MNGKTYLNWKIENFKCWNHDVHTTYIKSPILYFSYFKYIELYPRGFTGFDEHVAVRFCEIQKGFSGGELSFIGSDESIICTLQVNRENCKKDLHSSLGPKYEDVTALIRKKGVEEEDHLTLQFIPPSGKIYEQRMCTTLSVLQYSLGVDKNFIESLKSNSTKAVSFSSSYSEGNEGIFFQITRENEKVQLKLEVVNRDGKALLVEGCMRILSHDDTLLRYEENKRIFWGIGPWTWTFSDSLKYKELVDESCTLNICFYVVKGDMKIRYNHSLYSCKGITLMQKEEASSKSFDYSNQLKNSVSALSKELMCLFKDQDFSDLQLKCGTVSFPAHKAILSARSPVFKTMLSSDMIEAASSSVDIQDLDAPTLARFLVFLYTGTVDDLQGDSALKLYYVADKYQVPTLKTTCAAFLLANVSTSSVCDILSLADRHQNDELLSVARNFIRNNLIKVSKSEEWRNFMTIQPLLAAQTMTHITAKYCAIKKGNPQ